LVRNLIKISLWFNNDIKTYYGELIEDDPLTINISNINLELLASAVKISILVIDGEEKINYHVKLIEFKDDLYRFENIGKIENAEFLLSLYVNYNGNIEIAEVDNNDIVKYINLSNKINSSEGDSLTDRLNRNISDDSEESPLLISYLLELNNKMEEILSLLRPKLVVDNSIHVTSVSISPEWLIFYSSNRLADGLKIFIHVAIFESGNKLIFGVLANIRSISIDGIDRSDMYIADYLDISDELKDRIIKFIFAKDRASIKQLK